MITRTFRVPTRCAALGLALMLLALVLPVARAGVISISDVNPDESMTLQVAKYDQSTVPGDALPGTGPFIDITTPTPSNGVDNILYGTVTTNLDTWEQLSFKFANQVNWNTNAYYYRFFTGWADPDDRVVDPTTGQLVPGYSDLFVIQGRAGEAPDYITFVSDVNGSLAVRGDHPDPTSYVPNMVGATPTDLGTISEDTGWKLAYDTGVDQYYIQSAVPEPATVLSLGIGCVVMAGYVCSRRKR